MRYLSFSTTVGALLALTTITACNKTAPAHDDLAADLASVSSTNDLALAPTTAGRSTVSAAEQLAPHTVIAPSRRSAPHRTPHVTRQTTTVAQANAPVAEQVAEANPAPEAAPLILAPRPHQMSTAGTGAGTGGIRGSDIPNGGGAGQTIGTIFGVIIRGGVGDGDHCDPRPRRFEPQI